MNARVFQSLSAWEHAARMSFFPLMTGSRHLQEQAASLFGLAEDAFDQGKPLLGEELTALALRYLDEAQALERSPRTEPEQWP
jgi:hypothetical protein